KTSCMQMILTPWAAAASMNCRFFSVFACLILSIGSETAQAFLAWINPQRTTLGIGQPPSEFHFQIDPGGLRQTALGGRLEAVLQCSFNGALIQSIAQPVQYVGPRRPAVRRNQQAQRDDALDARAHRFFGWGGGHHLAHPGGSRHAGVAVWFGDDSGGA